MKVSTKKLKWETRGESLPVHPYFESNTGEYCFVIEPYMFGESGFTLKCWHCSVTDRLVLLAIDISMDSAKRIAQDFLDSKIKKI